MRSEEHIIKAISKRIALLVYGMFKSTMNKSKQIILIINRLKSEKARDIAMEHSKLTNKSFTKESVNSVLYKEIGTIVEHDSYFYWSLKPNNEKLQDALRESNNDSEKDLIFNKARVVNEIESDTRSYDDVKQIYVNAEITTTSSESNLISIIELILESKGLSDILSIIKEVVATHADTFSPRDIEFQLFHSSYFIKFAPDIYGLSAVP